MAQCVCCYISTYFTQSLLDWLTTLNCYVCSFLLLWIFLALQEPVHFVPLVDAPG